MHEIHKVNWCNQVKSQNSVHTLQFVEMNKYYIFGILNSKRRFGWRLKAACQYHSKTSINNLKKYLGFDYMEFFHRYMRHRLLSYL